MWRFFLLVLYLTTANSFHNHFAVRSVPKSKCLLKEQTQTEDKTISAEKPKSFVNDVMRPYAMKLHTRDQAPKEGQQAPQRPVTAWEPTREGYLKFLVDSLAVYEQLESTVKSDPRLKILQNNGLERSEELKEDIEWMLKYDNTLSRLEVGPAGSEYVSLLNSLSKESLPKYMCHYYNQYFAHTAGGIMMGKMFSQKLLDGAVLKFYTWKVPDVKVLLDDTKKRIDSVAETWTEEEKEQCLQETMTCFKYSGNLLSYMK